MMTTPGQQIIHQWFLDKKWEQFPFQRDMEESYLAGKSGLLNAPTGSGKTYAMFLPFLEEYINAHLTDYKTRQNNGLMMLWITPLRALTNDIRKAMQAACDEIGLPWKIAARTGDTSAAEKAALRRKLPEVLLTTPESLHLMLAQKDYPKLFQNLKVVVVDEWHELLGTKRGVQVELGMSRLKALSRKLEAGIKGQESEIKIQDEGGVKSQESRVKNQDEAGVKSPESRIKNQDETGVESQESRIENQDEAGVESQESRIKNQDEVGVESQESRIMNQDEAGVKSEESEIKIQEEGGVKSQESRIKNQDEASWKPEGTNDGVENIERKTNIRTQTNFQPPTSGFTPSSGFPPSAHLTLKIWGISATIGNLEEAGEVLLGNDIPPELVTMVKANIEKKIVIESVIPEDVETYSWSGHIGLKLLPQVMEIVARSNTTLIFTNTRSQSEIWYHAILDKYPEYAGIMAMHHGSLDNDIRAWVEQALHNELLKVVVCTSSLDLGVDFRPVDAVVQIGSPKGVARFMQRAGRSGHHPGAVSRAYYVPTHSLELLEGAALQQALKNGIYESRDPIILALDVLMQYMVTLAVSDGFFANDLFKELKTTFGYADLKRSEYNELLDFITHGGKTLAQYDEFLKVEIENGLYKVNSRRVALRHRLSIGTITSDVSIRVKWISGGSLGTIEESFVSRLKPGDNFWFAGRSLEFVRIKEMSAYVKKSNKKKGLIPSWAGGRMPLSSQLSAVLRSKLDEVAQGIETDVEVKALRPLFDIQRKESHLPRSNEFLIEYLESREGHHLLFYPFEGRLVHEGMASLLAYRISKFKNASFSIAMNDYGFELLTDDDIPLREALQTDLFTLDNLLDDIQQSLNANEMARRRFRDIAHIGGLIFTGYPGQPVKGKHLQASSSLLFDVFSEYEPNNLLVRQAYNEALAFQLEEFRLRAALQRIQKQKMVTIKLEKPSPFSFPILVDSLGREKLTTETLEERVAKMAKQYEWEDSVEVSKSGSSQDRKIEGRRDWKFGNSKDGKTESREVENPESGIEGTTGNGQKGQSNFKPRKFSRRRGL